MTEPEILLWSGLKHLRRSGAKFRRQVVLGNHIVDFACHKSRIVVELDGSQHSEDAHAERDSVRDRYLEGKGYKVMRFWNNELWPHSSNVLNQIANVVEERLPSP